jgi:hypothetical protein
MKPIARFAAALTCAIALPLAAQSAPPASVPPPPGLDDPGVSPLAPARNASVFPNAALRHDQRDLRGEPPPTVDVRKQGGDTIQEYRVAGRVTMIRIIPKHGPVQTFYTDPQGRLIPDPREGPVRPVYYTLYTWQH